MNNHKRRFRIVIASTLLAISIIIHAQSVNSCPDAKPTVGRYRNYNYGFIINIPKSLKAYWNSPACKPNGNECTCMSDHGREIPLDTPDSYIVIYTGYNSTMSTLSELLKEDLETFRKQGNHIEPSIQMEKPYWLKGHRGVHYIATLIHGEKVLVREAVIVLSRDNGIEYSITIQADEKTYRKYRNGY